MSALLERPSAAVPEEADAELLAYVAASAARACGVARCGLYLRDADGRFRGRASHPATLAEAVRHITAGGPSDALTREIVDGAAPVLIRDAVNDPRGALSAVRAWKVRAILGVPIVHAGEVTGLLYLDNAGAPHPYADAQVEAAAAIARLAGESLAHREAFNGLRAERDAAVRQNRLLRRAALADQRFDQVFLAGGGVTGVLAALAELTAKPAAFYDARGHRIATAGTWPERLAAELPDVVAGASATLAATLAEGVRHRRLIAPADIGEERCGWVVLRELPARFSAFDDLAIRRAARHVAFELAAARRATSAAWDARALLARQLIRGTQDEDVRRGAECLGIELDAPRAVGFVEGQLDAGALVAALERRLPGVLATRGPEGIALIVDLPLGDAPLIAVRRVKAALGAAFDELGADPVAGLSAACRAHGELPRAYREAREVARCIDAFAGRTAHRVLAADDLGPGRLFVARGDGAGLERFVQDVLGPLLGGEEAMADLLRTLHAFFDQGRSIRRSAACLDVHENTVRYRLARVESLTGLDVAGDASDQLSVQIALLSLRLGGHPVLPALA